MRSIENLARKIHTKLRRYPLFYSDRSYTENRFFYNFGYLPDLENPQTFNEKVNYKKLFDRRPLLMIPADKLKARAYVADIIGEKYLPCVYHIFRKKRQIHFDDLPNQFVVKATHGSNWVRIIWDKEKEDLQELKNLCGEWLKKNYYYSGREWCYKHIQPGIMVEELLIQDGDTPIEYNHLCFDGKVKMIQARYPPRDDLTQNFFDEHGNLQQVTSRRRKHNYVTKELPANYTELIEIAEQVSKEFDFIRVDLYNIDGKIYFAELTNYPANGFSLLEPKAFDIKLGSYWKKQEY